MEIVFSNIDLSYLYSWYYIFNSIVNANIFDRNRNTLMTQIDKILNVYLLKEKATINHPNTWKYIIKKSIILDGQVSFYHAIIWLIRLMCWCIFYIDGGGTTLSHEKSSNILWNHNELFALAVLLLNLII